VNDLLKRIRATWNGLSLNHRVMFALVTVGTVVALVATFEWAHQATYTTLYSNLAPAEAGEIVDLLANMDVPYRISAGGSSLQVPDGEAQAIRLKLAAQGYPRDGIVGYEIFDKTNLGMTDFLQKVNFRRALEGEIAKTIMSLSEVSAARVHLVMPEARLFSKDQKQPTASVVLKLNGTLSENQVAGISHLVASSVEGLEVENISIVDYRGKLLTDKHAADPDTRLSSTQMDLRKSVELHLEEKAQTLLDQTLGPGKAVVRVIADLNFDKVEKSAENYDPDRVAIRSEEVQSAKPGTEGEGANQSSTVTNYEISKSVEHVVSAFGSIERLSVAVMVDGTYKAPAEGIEDAQATYAPRPAEELQQIAAIVRTAVGYDSTRSDHLEIVNMAFDTTAMDETQNDLNSVADYDLYYDIGKKVLYGALILLGLLYVRRVFKTLAKALSSASAPGQQAAAAAALAAQPDLPQQTQRIRASDVFGERARGRPEEVAKIIKTMMSE
jgi:flagellar M-ring protein FliF